MPASAKRLRSAVGRFRLALDRLPTVARAAFGDQSGPGPATSRGRRTRRHPWRAGRRRDRPPGGRAAGHGRSASPCRGGLPRRASRQSIDHCRCAARTRCPKGCSLAFDRRAKEQLEHEDMVAARQFPIRDRSRTSAAGPRGEAPPGILPPACGLGEVRKRAAGRELAGRLGDVVVGRGPVAAQAGQVFLVMMQLTHEVRVLFEQRRDVRPPRQEAPHPDPGSSRTPSSMPLVQCTPGNGVAPPPGAQLRRELGIRASAVRK